jgi:hypothetical protein
MRMAERLRCFGPCIRKIDCRNASIDRANPWRLITNLPTDLSADLHLGGGAGRTFQGRGRVLGRSQPAISLQIRRLEELIRAPLLIARGPVDPADTGGRGPAKLCARNGADQRRGCALFPPLGHERRAADRAAHRLCRGVPANTLTGFLRSHPDVDLEIHCDLSRELLQQLRSDESGYHRGHDADVQRMPYLSRAWVEQPIWVAADSQADRATARCPLARIWKAATTGPA